jgi:hypothetical protein
MFGFSVINWPPGTLARLNVLVAKPWHVVAVVALVGQGVASLALLTHKKQASKSDA